MPIKLGNNAVAQLAAQLEADGTTIVLVEEQAANFPPLAAGEFFPMTLSDAAGHHEIVRVTSISANILTATRGQEGTDARLFLAGDRAEIRMTAGVIAALRDEIADGVSESAAALSAEAAALRAEATAAYGDIATNLAVALGDLVPTGFGPAPWSLPVAPNGWIFADGRTLFSNSGLNALRAAYIAASFPFGQDGSGNPKIPDMRGRVPAGVDNMGSDAAGRLSGATIGAGLGAQTHTLTAAEMPVHAHGVTDPTHGHSVYDPTHAHGVYDPGHAHTYDRYSAVAPTTQQAGTNQSRNSQTTATSVAATGIGIYGAATGISIYASGTGISIHNAGSGGAHNNVQPTLVCNYIIKA